MTAIFFKNLCNISIESRGNKPAINFYTADTWAKMLFRNTTKRTIRKMAELGI